VGAVAEAAVDPKRGHVLEGAFETFLASPESYFPDSRVVDEKGSSREREELAAAGGMPAAIVRRPHRRRALDPGAQEPIDQSGFADSRRAHEDRGLAGLETPPHLVETAPVKSAQSQDVDPECDLLDLAPSFLDLGAKIELGEEHRGRGAALPHPWRGIARDASG
jgi:hypothetical protein